MPEMTDFTFWVTVIIFVVTGVLPKFMPLFEGKEPEVMLTNRRVTVELLEAAIPELIASSQTIPIKE